MVSMKFIDQIEHFILKHSLVGQQNYSQKQHIILIPGMSGPAWQLIPLAHFLSAKLGEIYSVTIAPLGFSWDNFATLTLFTSKLIDNILAKQSPASKVILIGHSHGGRVAWNTASYLQKKYPYIKVQLITLASPLDYKPMIPFVSRLVNRFSRAFQEWPPLSNLELNSLQFTALYSDKDIVVTPKCATSNINDKYLLFVPGIQHFQFLEPKKIGDILIKCINK